MELLNDITNFLTVPYRHDAAWTGKGLPRSHDMKPFGPDVTQVDTWAQQPPFPDRPKPVLYAPVLRDQAPTLSLDIPLFELGRHRSKDPPWEGLQVKVTVSNLWNPAKPVTTQLQGTVKKLVCSIPLQASTLQDWTQARGFNAQLNENLLDFEFEVPGIQISGKPFRGQSRNRLFLYRRRLLVFLPGVFGSKVQLKGPKGETRGFPDFIDEESGSEPLSHDFARLVLPIQQIGVLESDSDGKTLVQPEEPKLLTMNLRGPGELGLGPKVYNVFRALHEARCAQHPQLPDGFMLYKLFAFAYDWRGDLTETAKKQLERLQKLRDGACCRKNEDRDVDDRITVVGHSTGGLLTRRMMKEPGAKEIIGHAFFINVPFRGSAKPLPVIPTGCDPFGGESMIKFIQPLSIRSIALTAPIVYHLSCTPHYTDAVFWRHTPEGTTSYGGMDGVRAWVEFALDIGFMPPRKVVPADPLRSMDEGLHIALNADRWTEYWDQRFERERGRLAMSPVEAMGAATEDARHMGEPGVIGQDAFRHEQGWSDVLEKRARDFHAACETVAQDKDWVDRSYIFYSVYPGPTTVGIDARLESTDEYPSFEEFRTAVEKDCSGREPHPKREFTKKHSPTDKVGSTGAWLVEKWRTDGARFFRDHWRLTSVTRICGDGTVPLSSQLGFGAKVRVFKKLVNAREIDNPDASGPVHSDAANSAWVWARIINVLENHDLNPHLPKKDEVNTIQGLDHDHRIAVLQTRAWAQETD